MELVHADIVVDVLGPGECFGHPSLLSAMAPAFSVRAREAATCVVIDREMALRVFADPSGARFVARSLRHRLVETGRTIRALPDLSMTRLGALGLRPPVVVSAADSVRDVAAAMTAAHAGAALADTADGMRIVTDRDLRDRVLAAGRSSAEPIGIALRAPRVMLAADRTAGEALVELLVTDERVVVVVDRRGGVQGVVGAEEIAGGQHSPFALRSAVARAPDEDALAGLMTAGMAPLLVSLLSAGLAPEEITRVLAVQGDAATARLLDLAFARHGPAPAPWAWLALGSVARRELTLASDQDNALAFDDGAPDTFFAQLAADVNGGLARCGLGEDHADVLARDARWRMAASAWVQVFRDCLEHPDRSHLVRAAVAFDFRQVAGGLDVVTPLTEVVRDARRHAGFIGRLARTATDWKPPLGRLGRIVTDRDGMIDLKLGGALPIANLARLHAVAAGITISSTIDRLVAAEEVGALDADTATSLREAFNIVSRTRLEHHAACLADGRAPDNRIDPTALAPLHRAGLREAFRAIAGAQRQLAVYVPAGL